MITLGIDLATDPRRTAACEIEWPDSATRRPVIRALTVGLTNEMIGSLARESDATAIDAPFGWPRAWADAVGQHRPGMPFEADGPSSVLTMRDTDRWISTTVGVRPLAVAANLIGATAIRCARLIHEIGLPVDVGVRLEPPFVCEVYPAAALRGWGLSHQLYKGKQFSEARGRLVDDLIAAGLPLELDPHRAPIQASDDALDAVICSLLARATAIGMTVDAPLELRQAAKAEGWIRVPTGGTTLSDLLPEAIEPMPHS